MNAREITQALKGRWHGSYGMISCPVPGHGSGSGDPDPSLKVSDGEDGPRFHCFAGCDWRDVKDTLRREGLLPEWCPGAEQQPKTRGSSHRQGEKNEHVAAAREIWRRAQPIAGTVGELYLRRRGISIAPPPTLRYLPGLEHRSSGQLLPALIAGVQQLDGCVSGVHRIFLRADGRGVAPVTSPKMMLGRVGGGAVRLAPAASRLGIAEGIENGLSIAQAIPDLPVWCALSVGNIGNVVLPPVVREVVLFVDGDPTGSQATKTAQVAAERFASQGRRVTVADPGEDRDFNDLLVRDAV